MKRGSNKKNPQGGSALMLVLVFMTLMLILGTGLLLLAEQGAKQSVAVMKTEKHYYSAESAAQLAAQVYMQEFNGINKYKSGIVSTPAALNAFINNFENEVRQALQNMYLINVASVINTMRFNGEEVTLGSNLEILKLAVSGNVYELRDEDGNISYIAYAYLEEHGFSITSTSGGRTVSVSMEAEGEMEVTVDKEIITTEIIAEIEDQVASIEDQNGKFVLSGNVEYNTFRAGLEKLIEKARNYSASAPDAIIDIANQRTIASGVYTSSNASTVTSAGSSVYCNGNLTLNNIGTNNTIEYLHVNGNFTIQGTVNLPNLKAVYVSGDFTIAQNASLSGDGRIVNNSIVGSNFVIDGNMSVSLPSQAYHCRFYVPFLINMTTSANNQKLTGNSVYVAYAPGGIIRVGTGHNGVQLGDDTHAPQFYATNEINLYLQGSAYAYGLYAALNFIDRNNPSTNNLDGFWLGGSGNPGGSIVTGKLNDNAIENLLDYGLIFKTITQKEIITVTDETYAYKNGGMGIREITGETP